jgi:hypothetical protein
LQTLWVGSGDATHCTVSDRECQADCVRAHLPFTLALR